MANTPLQVGIVDLDTSHPQAFAKFLRQMEGVQISAVWNGGDVTDEQYTATFAAQHNIPYVATTLDDMVERCDVALITSADWNAHLPRASAFLQRGVPVYIDKPVCGSVADVRRLGALAAANGTWVAGGSPVRFCPEVAAQVADAGKIRTLFGACPGPYFYYGIHLVELAQHLLGNDITAARARRSGNIILLELMWEGSCQACFEIGANPGIAALASRELVADGKVAQIRPLLLHIRGQEQLRLTMEAVVTAARCGKPPINWAGQEVVVAAMHAGQASLMQSGEWTPLSDVAPIACMESAAFLKEYAAQRRLKM